ncbi:hypothetical protein D3C81_1418910 [compost metagenome]
MAGIVQRVLQGNRAPKRIADQHAARQLQCQQLLAQRGDEEIQRVFDIVRLGRQAIAGQVHHHGTEARRGEGRHIAAEVAVAARARPAAMDKDHGFAAARVQAVQPQAPGGGDEASDRQVGMQG